MKKQRHRSKLPVIVEWRSIGAIIADFPSWNNWMAFRRYRNEQVAQEAIEHFQRSYGPSFEFRIASK